MPKLIQRLYPERIWAFSNSGNTVYLTFDDGPIPEITSWVLDLLKERNAKATFFCIGDNIRKNPKTFQKILLEGHSIGNHTFNHLNGWKTKTSEYVENVEKAGREMLDAARRLREERRPKEINSEFSTDESQDQDSQIFRPPYGKITSKQARNLQRKGFKIVMWNIISYDFDSNISEEQCLSNVLNYLKPGSIVVFHDSLKAEKNLRYVLPKVLDFISERGWKCERI